MFSVDVKLEDGGSECRAEGCPSQSICLMSSTFSSLEGMVLLEWKAPPSIRSSSVMLFPFDLISSSSGEWKIEETVVRRDLVDNGVLLTVEKLGVDFLFLSSINSAFL